MKNLLSLTAILLLSACSTLNDSLKLGATMGAVTGAAATYAAQSSTGATKMEDVAVGAGAGLAIGLLTSYIVHKQVDEDRQTNQSDQIQMHFGDLPPSPFIMPPPSKKKGAR